MRPAPRGGLRVSTRAATTVRCIQYSPYRGNYDDGGWLMPGLTLARNDTGVPERVVPPGGDTIRLDIHTDGPLTDSQVARLADAVKESLARDRRHAVFMTS